MSFIYQKTANQVMMTIKSAKRIKPNENDEANRMVCYNGYKIPSFGRVIAPIESGGWTIRRTSLIVVDDRRKNILGRNLLPLIGVHLQQQPAGKSVNTISDDINCSDAKITNWLKSTYPGLCTRIGIARNHMVHTTFLQEFKAYYLITWLNQLRKVTTNRALHCSQQLTLWYAYCHLKLSENTRRQCNFSIICVAVDWHVSVPDRFLWPY